MWILWTLLAVSSWAVLNVIDSLLVRHFESRPLVISWVQCLTSVPILFVLGYFLPIENDWALSLFLIGSLGFGGDYLFWKILNIADVSSSNYVGIFIALIMTIVGFLFFGEVLSARQILGAVLVFIGIGTLSLSRGSSLSLTALALMACAGVLYAPFNILQKYMLTEEQTFFSSFFWLILGREMAGITIASLYPVSRRQIISSVPRQPRMFFVYNIISITLFLFAMYCISRAYVYGSGSLVSILANIQPFLTIAVASLFAWILPHHAPRELLTSHSLQVKFLSFACAFVGLALLGSVM